MSSQDSHFVYIITFSPGDASSLQLYVLNRAITVYLNCTHVKEDSRPCRNFIIMFKTVFKVVYRTVKAAFYIVCHVK